MNKSVSVSMGFNMSLSSLIDKPSHFADDQGDHDCSKVDEEHGPEKQRKEILRRLATGRGGEGVQS